MQSNNLSYSQPISESLLICMILLTSSLQAPDQIPSNVVYMILDFFSLQPSLACPQDFLKTFRILV